MATIVTRAGKGSPLTNAEVDANFTNLNSEFGLYLPKAGGTVTGLLSITTASLATPFELIRNSTQNIGGKFANTNYTTFFGLGSANGELRVGTSADLQGSGNIVLHSANVGSYAPSLTGTGASGTWGISITGSAASITGTYSGTLTSGQITTGLGFTPYNSTNPSGYITSSALSPYALLASPALTGVPTAPTAALSTDTTQIATTAYVNAEIANDAPTKTGGGASGTWGISITGSAASITGTYSGTLTSGQITTGLGFTPYNSTNPSGYITSSGSITGNAATATTITGVAQSFGLTTSAQNTAFANKIGPEVTAQGGGGAVMSFHRPGAYGLNMGLDSDNVFRIGGWSASANRLQMDMTGNLTMNGNVTAYSDERLKQNWSDLPADFVEQLALVKHGLYDRIGAELRQVGVGAQSLQRLLPEAVLVGMDQQKTLSVAYGNAALASAIQLAIRVVQQDKRIAALEAIVIGDN
jgi:hypothetical protein